MASNAPHDPESWRLNTPDLIQNMALQSWMNKDEHGEKFYKLVTGGRVWYEIYRRMSNQDEVEALRAECILAISDYIKKNPKASKEEVTKEVAKHIQIFADKIEAM